MADFPISEPLKLDQAEGQGGPHRTWPHWWLLMLLSSREPGWRGLFPSQHASHGMGTQPQHQALAGDFIDCLKMWGKKCVHVYEREKERAVSPGRRRMWKRYSLSLQILAKPLQEKVEFSLHNQQCVHLFKRKKKSWEASRWRVLMRKKRSVVSRTLGNCSKTVHPYAETVPVRSPAAALARVSTGCALGRA